MGAGGCLCGVPEIHNSAAVCVSANVGDTKRRSRITTLSLEVERSLHNEWESFSGRRVRKFGGCWRVDVIGSSDPEDASIDLA